jgi:hypothetical protein
METMVYPSEVINQCNGGPAHSNLYPYRCALVYTHELTRLYFLVFH